VNDTLWPGDNAARARYSTLTSALGGEPISGFHRAVLARLCAWTDAADIDALALMVDEAAREAMHAGASTGRGEALGAIARLILEVDRSRLDADHAAMLRRLAD
jgi:hypothetical protein